MSRKIPCLRVIFPSFLMISLLTASAAGAESILFERIWGVGFSTSRIDEGLGLATDASNDIYVSGTTVNIDLGSSGNVSGDVLLLKFNSSGGLIWQRAWRGDNWNVGVSSTVDAAGDVYVTGSYNVSDFGGSNSPTSHGRALILKFSPSGDLVWQRIWGVNSTGIATGVTTDPAGNIFVTGGIQPSGNSTGDLFLLKVSSSGDLLWQRTWGGGGDEVGYGLSMDSSGNVYVAGSTNSTGAGQYDALLLKFNSSGDLLGQWTWGSTEYDDARGVVADLSGSVYTTGSYAATTYGLGGDVFVFKFSSTGAPVWQKTWGGSQTEIPAGVAPNSEGDMYVAGGTNSFSGSCGPPGIGEVAGVTCKVFLLKLDPSGSLVIQTIWGGGGPNIAYGVGLDSSGSALVTGLAGFAPYNLTSANATLGAPTLIISNPSFPAGEPGLTLDASNGTLYTPTGNASSSGPGVFLLKYGQLPVVPTPAESPITIAATALAISLAAGIRSRRRNLPA